MSHITYKNVPPNPAIFAQFRADCGWGEISADLARDAVQNSLVFMCAYDKGQIVGFGRVIGDRALNYYIQDLIVAENARNKGIGKEILAMLMTEILAQARIGATIGLMAATDKERFYEQFGFIRRPNDKYGSGMTHVITII